MMKHFHQICLLLASTREWLANRDTLKVLTKIHVSKSILQFTTNCVGSIWQQCLPLENKFTMKLHRTIWTPLSHLLFFLIPHLVLLTLFPPPNVYHSYFNHFAIQNFPSYFQWPNTFQGSLTISTCVSICTYHLHLDK